MLINAGGVVVSYFEWLKNLNHVRFGRMNKRWEETGKRMLLDMIESATGTKLNAHLRDLASIGAEESQIVHSGLEETMITACKEVRTTALAKACLLPSTPLHSTPRLVSLSLISLPHFAHSLTLSHSSFHTRASTCVPPPCTMQSTKWPWSRTHRA